MRASKLTKWIIALLLLSAASIGNVWAYHEHSHVRFGVTIGGPYWGPSPYYSPPYYSQPYYPRYYPPVVIERAAPPIYIEQAPAPVILPTPAATAPPPTNFWYYCAATQGYYPYVRECPTGWQKVAPRPPGQS
jgi:hypothetical protein